jgi:hypothetical protein
MLIAFVTTDWSLQTYTRFEAETAYALWKIVNYEGLRIQFVEYSVNYFADHWSARRPIVFCFKEETVEELSTGEQFTITKNTSYQVSDGRSSHRTKSDKGANLFF